MRAFSAHARFATSGLPSKGGRLDVAVLLHARPTRELRRPRDRVRHTLGYSLRRGVGGCERGEWRPLLFWVSLPLTIITLGLFLIMLNAFLLCLTARIAEHSSQVHFEIDHFWWDALLGAIIISVVSCVVGMVVKPPKRLIL